MRVFLNHLGCKLNQAEIEQLGRQLLRAGCQLVGSVEDADLQVLNTCSVTHLAARDSRKLARRGRRQNPHLRTVLTGCYVDSDAAEAAGLSGVDLVVPNRDKDRLLERIREHFSTELPMPEPVSQLPVPYVPLEFGNTRALVKVEDGCNMRCSFCIIPSTRGPQRSRPLPEIVEEVQGLGAAGYSEVVVTGVQISSYRWQRRRLYDLSLAILGATDLPRLRLTSIAPWQFDHRLLELFDSDRLCRHLHLSLQSGCTETLRRMRRPYTASEFGSLVEEIRRRVPGVAITTDVIVGFPGESEAEFEDSLAFAEEMDFARLHAFPYSPRSGTEAAGLPQQVSPATKRRRMERMLAVAERGRRRFERHHVATTATVLWEYRRQGSWYGMTDNYLRVVTESDLDLAHRLTPVELAAVEGGGLTCQPPPAAA